jgi:hypothetical protein
VNEPGRDSGERRESTTAGAELLSRYIFLQALRYHVPDFWRGLHQAWQTGEADAIEWWCGCAGVVDLWFLEVIRDTIEYWNANAESPSTQLQDGFRWFWWKRLDSGGFFISPFAPSFTDPFPRMIGPCGSAELVMTTHSSDSAALRRQATIEPLDELEARLRLEFNHQLAAYMSQLKAVFSGGAAGMADLRKHASWTALVFAGFPSIQIAEGWRGLRYGTYEDPEKAVYRAVKRFSDRIGLSLPARRGKGNTKPT